MIPFQKIEEIGEIPETDHPQFTNLPYKIATLFNAFNRILKRSNIDKMPIHALRHTHAVLLLESGADMKYIQERLGHKSMMVTADVYSHISKKLDQNRIKDYENYVSSIVELNS